MQLLSFSSQSSISNILLLYYSSACLLVHCLLQAVQDDDEFSETKEEDSGLRVFINNKDPSTSESTCGKSLVPEENDYRENVCAVEESMTGWSCAKDERVEKALSSSQNQETMDAHLRCSSNLRGDWKRRFFVLDSRGMLYDYRKLFSRPSGAGNEFHARFKLLMSGFTQASLRR